MNLSKIKNMLLGWVKGQSETQQDRKGPWAWIAGLVVTLVSMAGLAFMAYREWKQGKEIAKLKHERDVAEEVKHRGEMAKQVTKNEVRAAVLRKKGRDAEEKIKELDEQLKGLEENATKNNQEIDALRNWRDVDLWLAQQDGGS